MIGTIFSDFLKGRGTSVYVGRYKAFDLLSFFGSSVFIGADFMIDLTTGRLKNSMMK